MATAVTAAPGEIAKETRKAKLERRRRRREARAKIKAGQQAHAAIRAGTAPPALGAVPIPAGPTEVDVQPVRGGPTAGSRDAWNIPGRPLASASLLGTIGDRPLPSRPEQPHVRVQEVNLPFPKQYKGGLTNQTAEIILAALRGGCSHRMACGIALIHFTTLSRWMHAEEEPYLTFQTLVRQAEALPKVFLLDSVMSGSRVDPYLALDVLARKDPEEFGKKEQKGAGNVFNFNLGELLERANGGADGARPVGAGSTEVARDPRRALVPAST